MPPSADDTVEVQTEVTVGGTRWPRTFRALKHRNFRLFLGGQIVSLTGTWMEQTAMGWVVYQITGSELLLGVVAAAGTAPMLLFSIWGGALADRHSKRAILVWTQAVQMVLAFLLAALVWRGGMQPWHIIVISLLNGVANGFDMPARQAFIAEISSREDLLNAISLNSSTFNAARIVGPSLAGVLMAKGGAALCFFLNGVSFLAVIAGLLLMRLPTHVRPVTSESPIQHALGGLRYVWGNLRVRTIFTLFAIVGMFGWSYAVIMPAIAHDVLHQNEAGYGLLLAAGAVGALAGALTVATAGDRYHPRVIALSGVWIFSAALLAFAAWPQFYLALPLLAIVGFGMMLFFSTANTTVQILVPDAMRGRVMGVWSLLFGAIIPLGALEAGALAGLIGGPQTIALGAIICAVSGAVVLVIVRKRDLRAAVEAASP